MESLWRLLALSTHSIFSICMGEEHLGQFILCTSDATVAETIYLYLPGTSQTHRGRAITTKLFFLHAADDPPLCRRATSLPGLQPSKRLFLSYSFCNKLQDHPSIVKL
jgi:hypothetical protein